jgi:hypothetical protein
MKRWGILMGALFVFGGLARGQAVINEGLETATLYVDVVNGNDNNSGSQGEPFKTIGKSVAVAEANNQSGIGTHVYINPGLYRENIDLQATERDTLLPETYEAATAGTVLISGADPYTNWTQYSRNSKIYSTPWTYNFGLCPPVQGTPPPQTDIVLRREMALVNGVAMDQVLALGQMLEGTFYVDDGGQQFYLWPPAGTDLNRADVELADRGQLWAITNKNGVVLRGLTFEYSADCKSDGAVELNFGPPSQNIEFDSDNFLWNNATGLHLFMPTDYTIKNVVANHNGAVGMEMYDTVNGLVENTTADFNNWRGGQGGFYMWGEGGINPYGLINGTFSNINTDWNFSTGIHWDTNNENTIGTNINSRSNFYDGILLERNNGPMQLTNLNLCYNSSPGLTVNGGHTTSAGLAIRDSENVTIENSVMYGNGNGQLNVLGLPGGIPILNWQTGQIFTVYTKDITNTNNVLEATDGGQNTLRDSYLNGGDWHLFINTLNSEQNTWWNGANNTPFVLPVPGLDTATDFSGWQSESGQDSNSQFKQPSKNYTAQCTLTPDLPDVWPVTTGTVLTVDPSGQATSTYSYEPLDGFSTTLNLTMDGISEIPGASATLTPTTIPNGAGSAIFALTAKESVAPGTYQFTVLANGGSMTRALSAFLIVPQTSLRFAPSMTLNFGSVQVGQQSAPQTLTITNFGAKSVTGLVIGSAPAGFTYTKTCGPSLAAGKSCTVKITFSPNAGVNYSSPLTITDSDPTSPQTVTLTGTGIPAAMLQFSTYTMPFGAVIWNTAAMLSSIVTNTGTVRATFGSFTFSGTGAQYFTLQTNTCAGGLNPGDMCTLTVAFTPEVLAKESATLTIIDNTQAGKNTIIMTGTGKTSVTVTPKALPFGTHKVGSHTTKTVTFTNAGNPLVVAISITGQNPGAFSYTTTCKGTVPTGSCTVSVTFTPLAKTSVSANLTFTDADPTSPQNVTMTGTGS